MIHLIAVISVFLSTIVSVKTIWAAGDSGRLFYHEMQNFSSACNFENCRSPYSIQNLYRLSEGQKIDVDLKKIFNKIADTQAQVWGDTILEGDYVAEGNTRVDRISKLYKNQELIGYFLTYSEKAWNTADCSYDGLRASTLSGCVAGRIVESSYVSPDFREYFYDESTSARFK
jgi:hypothetical protein